MKRRIGRAATALLFANGVIALSGCGGSEEATPVAPIASAESGVVPGGEKEAPAPGGEKEAPAPVPAPARRHHRRSAATTATGSAAATTGSTATTTGSAAATTTGSAATACPATGSSATAAGYLLGNRVMVRAVV